MIFAYYMAHQTDVEGRLAMLQTVNSGPTSCDGATLQMRALRAAGGMARLGIGRGDRIALLPREESGEIRKRLLREPYWADAGRKI